MKTKHLFRDSLLVGLAFFATILGTGNLIFPPTIGIQAGTQWMTGAFGLLLTTPLFPVVAMWSIYCGGGNARHLMHHVHPKFYDFLLGYGWITCTVCSVLPRISATVYEIGIKQLVPSCPSWVVTTLFFILLYVFAKEKDSFMEKLNKFLTPALVILLGGILLKGILFPVGEIGAPEIDNIMKSSMLHGYATGDLTLGLLVGNIFITSLVSKGYSKKDTNKGIIIAGIVCITAVSLVYGALTYLGATASEVLPHTLSQAQLLEALVYLILGKPGVVALCIVVALACLTNGTALASSLSSFYEGLFKHKISYKQVLIFTCIVGACLAPVGVSSLIKYVTPLFVSVYPAYIVMTILGFFEKYIPNDGIYKGGVYMSYLFGIFDAILMVAPGCTPLANFVNLFPFAEQGFAWIVPTVIAIIVTGYIYKGKPRLYYTESDDAVHESHAIPEERIA